MTTMHAALDQWQARLERRFASLAEKRAGSGFPIFALEHGLDQNELAEISGHSPVAPEGRSPPAVSLASVGDLRHRARL